MGTNSEPYHDIPRINIEPENDGLEDVSPFPGLYSQLPCSSSQEKKNFARYHSAVRSATPRWSTSTDSADALGALTTCATWLWELRGGAVTLMRSNSSDPKKSDHRATACCEGLWRLVASMGICLDSYKRSTSKLYNHSMRLVYFHMPTHVCPPKGTKCK